MDHHEDIEKEKTLMINSTCDRCPVACHLHIYYTSTGKLVRVEDNGCDQGISYSKNLLMNKFSEPW